MSPRCLRVLALLILAISVPAFAQSLGEVARESRAESQWRPGSHPKVITNEDIASPETARLQDSSASDASETAQAAEGASKKPNAEGEAADPKAAKSSDKPHKDPVSEHDAQELETQKRTYEINKRYLDRIAALRTQINTAQIEMAKLQRDLIESTNEYRRTNAASPPDYKDQLATFNTQIEVQRSLITTLNSQLEDAQESARHAGVPHASD
jgi:hypothetical protein